MEEKSISYDSISKKTGLSKKLVKYALSTAISEAIKDVWKPDYVTVDLKGRKAIVTYYDPGRINHKAKDICKRNLLANDPHSVVYDFKSFPPHLVYRVGKLFDILLTETKYHEDWKSWRSRMGTVAEGVIRECREKTIDVDLAGGQIGKFIKSSWVPKEQNSYVPGKAMFFYIPKVAPGPVIVFLSRAALKLPALLLKHHLPLYNFSCQKRYIGHKSFIQTDAPRDHKLSEARDLVSQELSGEILEIRNYSKMRPQKVLQHSNRPLAHTA